MAANTVHDYAEDITDADANVYDLRDVPNAAHYPNLREALRTVIQHFTVEFLYTNETKPHVVFKLNFRTPIGPGGRIHSARVSMEVGEHEETGEQGPGACQIKLCGYSGRTTRAAAGFQFRLRRQNVILSEVIQLITGQHPTLPNPMKVPMRPFTFIDIGNFFDGCRDWM